MSSRVNPYNLENKEETKSATRIDITNKAFLFCSTGHDSSDYLQATARARPPSQQQTKEIFCHHETGE